MNTHFEIDARAIQNDIRAIQKKRAAEKRAARKRAAVRQATHSAHVAVPAGTPFPGGNAADKWAAFLQKLCLHTALTRENRHGHYINIHHKSLQRVICHRYRDTIDQLEKAEVIEVNARYSTGREGTKPFPKSYRLTDRFRKAGIETRELQSKAAREKAAKVFEVDEAKLKPAGMHYRRHFPSFKVNLEEAKRDPSLKDFWSQWALARLATGNEFATRCIHGRYHSLITQLPRACRKHLRTTKGESLAMVDVSACQPLLLAGLVAEHQTRRPNGKPYEPEGLLLPYGVHCRKTGAAEDVQRWQEMAESREIYQFFRDELEREPGQAVVTAISERGRKYRLDLRNQSDAAFKRSCLIPLFQTVPDMVASPIYKIIEREFPTVANFLRETKQTRYQAVAWLLQSAESRLMIDGLGVRLASSFPDEPVQPIHDALLVRASFAEKASELIKEQFEAVGLHPQVKHEVLN